MDNVTKYHGKIIKDINTSLYDLQSLILIFGTRANKMLSIF